MFYKEGDAFNAFVRAQCVLVSNTDCKHNFYLI